MLFPTDVTGARNITSTDMAGPRPVSATDATTTITSVTSASQETLNRLSSISAGKQFQGQILSRLSDGTYLVRVADTTARMPLPGSPQAGETLTLTLLSTEPRPTFALGESSAAIQESVANMLQQTGSAAQVGQTAGLAEGKAGLVAAPLPGSTTATLSPTGRFLDNLLHAAQLDGTPTYLRGQNPLMPTPFTGTPGEIATLAQALQQSLEFSGLFYESHLAQWLNGERTREALMREPQARTGHFPEPSVFLRPAQNEHSLMDVLRALEVAQQKAAEGQQNQSQPVPLNNETARLIAQQLGALEQKRIEWQGELWPGKPFEWEVSEEDARKASGENENQSSWKSTVRFDMPSLGNISANIHLAASGHLQIHIQTNREDSAQRLRASGDSLVQALDAAGSPLERLTVSRHESGKTSS